MKQPQPLSYWLGCLLLVALLHGLALLGLRNWQSAPAIPVEPVPASMLLQLQPAPPTPPAPPAAPKPPAPVTPPAKAPTPKPVSAKPRPQPAPPPAPAPAPVPVPVPTKVVPGVDSPAVPGTPPPSVSAAAVSSWQSRLFSHLNRYKRYPDSARRRGVEGVNQLRFVIDGSGRVLSHELVTGSGSAALDRATVEMIRRAQPLPPPPAEILTNGRLEIVVPIVYSLESR